MATRDEVVARLHTDLAGINKSKVARSMGRSADSGRRSLRKWQNGDHLPSPELAVILARALGQPDDHYLVTDQQPAEGLLPALRAEVGVLAETVSNLTRAADELAGRVEELERRQQLRPAGRGAR